MRERTATSLYNYWNRLRRGRPAPLRLEIEPKHIAPLLPETFIVECAEGGGFRFRLAGTRICEFLGRELRNADLIDLWETDKDRVALLALVRRIVTEGKVGYGLFEIQSASGRKANFEMTLLPLVHDGLLITRLLGTMSAVNPPWWLGTETAQSFRLNSTKLMSPNDPNAVFPPEGPVEQNNELDNVVMMRPAKRRFRILDGGRTEPVA